MHSRIRTKVQHPHWVPNLEGNVARDAMKLTALKKWGYRVMVLWESDTRRPGRIDRPLLQI